MSKVSERAVLTGRATCRTRRQAAVLDVQRRYALDRIEVDESWVSGDCWSLDRRDVAQGLPFGSFEVLGRLEEFDVGIGDWIGDGTSCHCQVQSELS